MISKKHRYLVVETAQVERTAASLLKALTPLILAATGELGLGRMSPHVRFFDARARIGVVRVSRRTARDFVKATAAKVRVLRVTGSMRTCRPRLKQLLEERSADPEAVRAVDRLYN